MDLAEMLGDEKAKYDIPQFKGQPAFHVILTKMLDKQNTHTHFLQWLEMAQDPPPGYNFGNASCANAGVPWLVSPTGVVSPQPTEVPVYVVAGSTLFFARGGKKSKNQSIMEEVDFFLGKTTTGLKFQPIQCQKGATAKDLVEVVQGITPNSALLPADSSVFGLVRRAVLIVVWNCNEVANQSTKKSKWTEALQSNAERLVVLMAGVQYSFVVGPGKAKTWGISETFDSDADKLYSSMAEHVIVNVNGEPMFSRAKRSDL